MKLQRIGLVGGSGFVGRHLVAELARRGKTIRVLTRRRERHRDLLVIPSCELVQTDVHDAAALRGALAGCDAVVNLAGILNESGETRDGFEGVHARLPGLVGEACLANRITRLLHMSALNAGPAGPSAYLESKARGEEAAHRLAGDGVAVTSFRPSVIFGPDDSFFNRFASLLALSPLVFPLACPGARFAPVYVGDVVAAFLASLEDPATFGCRYDLCGPRVYRLRDLVEYTARLVGLRRRVIGLGDRLSRLQARVLERVPGKPFSLDNYRSLQVDSVCRGDNGLEALGITPTSVEAVVPSYLGGRNRAGRYTRFRRLAGRG